MNAYDLKTEAGILSHLQNGPFPASIQATRLTEGFCGFVYRVTTEPLADGTSSIIVKHVESYAARAPAFKLDKSRMAFEYQAMITLSELLDQATSNVVKLPKVLHYDEATYVLILEDVGRVPDLKSWLTPTTPARLCKKMGCSLGRFLADVHGLHQKHPSVMAQFDGNITARRLSALVYYGNLQTAAAKFGFHDSFIKDAAADAHEEVLSSREVLTLGDFWPGNVLVSSSLGTDSALDEELFMVDFEFVKPGTSSFDVGQMVAELYCLARFKDAEKGRMLLESFLHEYKSCAGQIDVAKVAIRVGAHLICVGPSAWGPQVGEKEVRLLVAEGVKLIDAGWRRDVQALPNMFGPLLGVFPSGSHGHSMGE